MLKHVIILSLFILATAASAQKVKLDENSLVPNHVYLSFEQLGGSKVAKVVKDSTVKPVDEPTFAKLKNVHFKNGTIEVKVLSRLLKNAPAFSRGFIGIAFRIDDKNAKYESIYIRPANGRVDDQVRRNHSTQYYSYPDYKFDYLRKNAAEKYESYADMGLNEWITIRIGVQGKVAKLFLNNSKQPVLVITDLKQGENAEGGIGLWVEVGTEGFFKDVKITHAPASPKTDASSPLLGENTVSAPKDRFFTSSDGVKLHYRVSGKGMPLVIFPGYGQDVTKFNNIYPELEQHFTVYNLDYRWLGQSESPAYGYHIERFAKDAKEMIDDAKIEQFYLFGHSMGNAVSWCYFSLFGQDKVLKYILGDEAPCLITDPHWTDQEVEMFTGSANRKEMYKAWQPPTKPQNMTHQQDMMLRLLNDHLGRDWRDVVATIKVPTLIIMGGKSHFESPLLNDWLHQNIKGSRLEVIKEGGHGYYETHPAEFNKLAIDFLKNK